MESGSVHIAKHLFCKSYASTICASEPFLLRQYVTFPNFLPIIIILD